MNHANFAQGTLAAAVTDTTGTSITVTSSTGFPTAPFIVSVDTEAMLVTTVAGTTWTVTRGYEGSTAAMHTNGATIYHDISAAEADSIAGKKTNNVSATDKILGRSSAGAGAIEEIACTAAGRAILDDADAAAQLATLGTAAYSEGTWTPVLNAFTIVEAAPVVTGTYKRTGNLVFITCTINAGAGGNTSVTCAAGVSNITTLPVALIDATTCSVATYSVISLGTGIVADIRIYPPTFSAQTTRIFISASYNA